MRANFQWNSVTLEPGDFNAPILAWTNNDKLVVFKDTKSCLNGDTKHPFSNWKWLVEKYNIKFWVYQTAVINEHPYDYGD